MLTRLPAVRRTCNLIALAGLAVAAGCHTGETVSSNSPKPSGTYKCNSVSSSQVVVSPPTVDVTDDVMRLSGTVQRRPGVTGILDGRVDVDLVGPDGLLLDKSLHCHLQPETVPTDATKSATYAPTPFGYVPPVGSTLRARYVDRQAAILEDLKDGDLDYNGNGGHIGEDVPRSQENGSMPTNPTGGGN